MGDLLQWREDTLECLVPRKWSTMWIEGSQLHTSINGFLNLLDSDNAFCSFLLLLPRGRQHSCSAGWPGTAVHTQLPLASIFDKY